MAAMHNEADEILQINIKELLQLKAPKIAKFIPSFVINYLTKLLHLTEINQFMVENYNLGPVDFVRQCNAHLGFTTVIEGGERIEEYLSQRPIIVGNHPLGGPESLALMEILNRGEENTKMVSNFILTYLKPLAPLLVPVLNGKDLTTIRNFNKEFKGDNPIIMFPAGVCSRMLTNGVFFDYSWHFTFIKMARKYRRPILPVYIDGANSKRFYRLSKIRNSLKIKTSFESIFLPDEMFKQKGKVIKIAVGNLIAPSQFTSSDDNALWANKVREHVFLMRQDYQRQFDPAREITLPAR